MAVGVRTGGVTACTCPVTRDTKVMSASRITGTITSRVSNADTRMASTAATGMATELRSWETYSTASFGQYVISRRLAASHTRWSQARYLAQYRGPDLKFFDFLHQDVQIELSLF